MRKFACIVFALIVVVSSTTNIWAHPKEDRMPQPKRLMNHVVLILDSSGSMAAIEKETREVFNEQVATIKKDAQKGDMDYTVTLSTFATVPNVGIMFAQKPCEVKELTERDYAPDGMTAMLDGVAQTVLKVEREICDINDDNTSVLVIILSDGLENNSKEYTYEGVAKIIKRLQDTGRWTFTYLGANQDLAQVQERLGLDFGNISIFTSDSAGMTEISGAVNTSVGSYLDMRREGGTSTSGFYDGSDKEEKE